MSKLALFFIFFIALSQAFERPWNNEEWIYNNPNIFSAGVVIWWNIPELQKTLESIEFSDYSFVGINESLFAKKNAHSNYYLCMRNLSIIPIPLTYIEQFQKVTNCIEYSSNWKATVDYSLSAIENSIEQVNMENTKLNLIYNNMTYLGLCNSNYSGIGSEYCNEIFVGLKNEKMSIASTYIAEINDELTKPIPDLGKVNSIINLNKAAIKQYQVLIGKANSSIINAHNELELLSRKSNILETKTDQEIEILEKEKIYLIKKSTFSKSLSNVGSIENKLSDIIERNKIAKTNRILLEQEKSFSYVLADLLTRYVLLCDNFEEIIQDSKDLFIIANTAIYQQREEALNEISKVPKDLSPDSRLILNDAQEELESGDNTVNIGEKFEHYEKSSKLARLAQQSKDFSNQEYTNQKLAQLEFLIEMAEIDEINVESEKQSLLMIEKLKTEDIDPHIENSILSIISKSKTFYEKDLLDMRSDILDKIKLSGESANDLNTDLERAENGIFLNDRILFPDSIGKLNELKENYQYILSELSYHMSTIIGNSMSKKCDPIISNVKLDEKSTISLDLVLPNKRPFSASNVSVFIPCEISFDFSDLSSGDLISIYNDEGIFVTFATVSPFEVKRLVFEKTSIIAHTINRKIETEALVDGVIKTNEELEFELDFPIPHLELDPALQVLIDNKNNGPLGKGTHILLISSIIQDGYSISTRDFQTFKQGLKTLVEYNIDINTKTDLKHLDIPIDVPSSLEQFHAYSLKGGTVEKIQKVSNFGYLIKVKSLPNASTTTIKVSYLVENISNYVDEQLAVLIYKNFSEKTSNIYNEASFLAKNGNYTMAFEKLELLKTTIDHEEKETIKLNNTFNDLYKNFLSNYQEIGNYSVKDPFFEKLNARKLELEKIIEELKFADLQTAVNILKSVDFNWNIQELNSLKKESYKEYNSLKQKFFSYGNFSTPNEFLLYEDALHTLEAGPRLEYGSNLVYKLIDVRSIVSNAEKKYIDEIDQLDETFTQFRNQIDPVLETYSKLKSSSKGTSYSGVFSVSESTISNQMKELQKIEEPSVFRLKLQSLNSSKTKMENIIDTLSNESQAKLLLVESLYKESNQDKGILLKISNAKTMHDSGDYVNSLRAIDQISKEIDNKKEEFPLLILGITGLAILGGISVFIIKKPKKELVKLKKAGDP